MKSLVHSMASSFTQESAKFHLTQQVISFACRLTHATTTTRRTIILNDAALVKPLGTVVCVLVVTVGGDEAAGLVCAVNPATAIGGCVSHVKGGIVDAPEVPILDDVDLAILRPGITDGPTNTFVSQCEKHDMKREYDLQGRPGATRALRQVSESGNHKALVESRLGLQSHTVTTTDFCAFCYCRLAVNLEDNLFILNRGKSGIDGFRATQVVDISTVGVVKGHKIELVKEVGRVVGVFEIPLDSGTVAGQGQSRGTQGKE